MAGPDDFSVLIAHPSRQHSHRLAAALHKVGLLCSYCTLLPTRNSLGFFPRMLDFLLPGSIIRNRIDGIPPNLISVLIGPLLIHKFFSRLRINSLIDFGELVTWVIFDHWVAKQVSRRRPDLVIGYEMCSVKTFSEAKKYDIPCVLDAAACHYLWADRQLPKFRSRSLSKVGRLLRDRKKLEADLADLVICTSNLAMKTYANAGVPSNRLVVNHPGCDIKLFYPAEKNKSSAGVSFIYIGQLEYHKGIDLLISVFDRILENHPNAKLTIIGSGKLSGLLKRRKHITYLGQLDQRDIGFYLRKADCLILPSRCDSYGMVVAEALASGVPAIVSENAGASELIQVGINGWTIESGASDALFDRMSKCCDAVDQLRAMANKCASTSSLRSWDQYGDRAVRLLKSLGARE